MPGMRLHPCRCCDIYHSISVFAPLSPSAPHHHHPVPRSCAMTQQRVVCIIHRWGCVYAPQAVALEATGWLSFEKRCYWHNLIGRSRQKHGFPSICICSSRPVSPGCSLNPEIQAVCGNMDFYEKRTWACVDRRKVANLQMKRQHYHPVSRFTSKNVEGFFPSCDCPGSRSEMRLLFVK